MMVGGTGSLFICGFWGASWDARERGQVRLRIALSHPLPEVQRELALGPFAHYHDQRRCYFLLRLYPQSVCGQCGGAGCIGDTTSPSPSVYNTLTSSGMAGVPTRHASSSTESC